MGILSGLAYGLAGGLEEGAHAAGDVADTQIKLNNQQENAKIISGQGYYLKTASGTPRIILNSTITDSATGVTDHLTDTLN